MSTDASSQPPNDTPPLPDDPAVLKQLIAELLATLRQRDHELESVRARLDQLLRRLYGPRAERVNADQLLLFADLVPSTPPAPPPEPEPEPTSPSPDKRGHGRRPLPRQLPRIRVTHEVPEAERLCPTCQQPRDAIGVETSEQLDYQPAALFVVVHERTKYACKHCAEHVAIADKPAQPINKGLPGPGLLAHVVTCKYADHLPLYRLERIFERQGVELARSTLCDWMAAAAELLRPLYTRLVEAVLHSQVLHTDDTPVPVLDDTRDTTRQGRMWVYLGDQAHPYTVFDYTPSRARDGPTRFLASYASYLQADAYGGYDGIYLDSGGRIAEVGCWAHARRKFFDARTTDPERGHAAIAWIRRLYDIEDAAKAMSDADRAARRQEQARPLLTAFRHWLEEQRASVLPKSPIGQATAYALSNWEALCRYTDAGFLAIDNNAAERAIRPIALGRKNWLHLGSDNGGHTAAVLFSFTATCRRHDLDPFAYLRDILTRLPGLAPDRFDELFPDHWQAISS
jgi:transposase